MACTPVVGSLTGHRWHPRTVESRGDDHRNAQYSLFFHQGGAHYTWDGETAYGTIKRHARRRAERVPSTGKPQPSRRVLSTTPLSVDRSWSG